MGMSAIPAETYARILNGEAVVDGPASARPGGQMRQMRACRPRSGKFAGVALALAPLALACDERPRQVTSRLLLLAGHEDVDKRPSGGVQQRPEEGTRGSCVVRRVTCSVK